jgi:hypothetical protein
LSRTTWEGTSAGERSRAAGTASLRLRYVYPVSPIGGTIRRGRQPGSRVVARNINREGIVITFLVQRIVSTDVQRHGAMSKRVKRNQLSIHCAPFRVTSDHRIPVDHVW